MSLRAKITGLARLFRFELPLAAGVCVLLGQLLALDGLPGLGRALLGFASVFLLSASSLILNDYFDLESDRVNAPERPLPAGLVTGRDVVALFVVVTALGLSLSYLLSAAALAVGAIVWFVGLLYNWRLKRAGLIGNLLVAFCVGMTFIFGGVSVGRPFEGLVWYFAALVMLVDLGEEIAADAMDLAGDRQAGSRSLAVVLGRANALRLSAASFLLVLLVSGLPFIFGWLPPIYLAPMLLLDGVIVYATLRLLDPAERHGRAYIRAIYLSGLVTLVLLLLLRLAW